MRPQKYEACQRGRHVSPGRRPSSATSFVLLFCAFIPHFCCLVALYCFLTPTISGIGSRILCAEDTDRCAVVRVGPAVRSVVVGQFVVTLQSSSGRGRHDEAWLPGEPALQVFLRCGPFRPCAGHRVIFGKVTDDSGAVLPGVTVTVTGPHCSNHSWPSPLTAAPPVPERAHRKIHRHLRDGRFKKVTRPEVVINRLQRRHRRRSWRSAR